MCRTGNTCNSQFREWSMTYITPPIRAVRAHVYCKRSCSASSTSSTAALIFFIRTHAYRVIVRNNNLSVLLRFLMNRRGSSATRVKNCGQPIGRVCFGFMQMEGKYYVEGSSGQRFRFPLIVRIAIQMRVCKMRRAIVTSFFPRSICLINLRIPCRATGIIHDQSAFVRFNSLSRFGQKAGRIPAATYLYISREIQRDLLPARKFITI